MASISYDPATGRRTIQFMDRSTCKRRTIRLVLAVSQRSAETIRVRVEALNAALLTGCPLDGETALWLRDIGIDLAAKLAKVGLIAERVSMTLGKFIDSFITGRSDVKASTRGELRPLDGPDSRILRGRPEPPRHQGGGRRRRGGVAAVEVLAAGDDQPDDPGTRASSSARPSAAACSTRTRSPS